MQPATIRRLLVFGVCLAGVGGLYLVPGIARAPVGLGSAPARHDLPTSRPDHTVSPGHTAGPVAFTTSPAATSSLSAGTTGSTLPSAPSGAQVGGPATSTEAGAGTARSASATTTRMAAATAGVPGRDHTPPGAVGRVSVTRLDAERLSVSWPEASDDVAVVSYRVWLNGFLVLDTQQHHASLAWFNDSSTHVVQVQALDAVGNQGPSSPTLLVVRPSPSAPPPNPHPSTTLPPSTSPSPPAGDSTDGPALAPPAPAGSSQPGDVDQEDFS
ncbi:hypothetical protein GCM10022204_33050 [Microlunatus aurantiacus]|uniref:Fibronectin type-III domain-containing protein n=1 Tax=Microlunatus aurantiacus TaxID=446786 RepID=A0ABP7DY92_9ACTN